MSDAEAARKAAERKAKLKEIESPPLLFYWILGILIIAVLLYSFALLRVTWPGWVNLATLDASSLFGRWIKSVFALWAFISMAIFFVAHCEALVRKRDWVEILADANIYILLGCFVGTFVTLVQVLIIIGDIAAMWPK